MSFAIYIILNSLVLPNIVLWAWIWLVPIFVVSVPRIYANAQGLALPGIVFVIKGADQAVLRHELHHIRQMQCLSPLGVSILLAWYYGIGYLRHRIKYGNWPTLLSLWHENPIEIEANRAMYQEAIQVRYIVL